MASYFSGINRVAGLASGFDIDQLVKDLMQVARAPVDQLLQKKQILQWKQMDYRAVTNSLIGFRTNQVLPMKLQATFAAMTATTSDATAVTATPSAGATPGTYRIEVTQLAQTASDISSGALSLAPGDKIDAATALEPQKAKFANSWGETTGPQFSITTYKTDGTPVTETFTIDTTTQSLNNVVAAINAKTSTLGVTAFYESSTDKIVISTTRTGDYATNEIEVADVTGTFALGTLRLAATANGQNAVVSVNGLTGITKYDNSFSFNNITFNLHKETSGTPVTVVNAYDTDSIVNSIKSFVEQLNAMINTINAELNESRYPKFLPLTDAQREELTDNEIEQWEEKAKSGLLQNDTILRSTVYDLRRAFTSKVTGLTTAYDSIYDIGISTGYWYEEGKLYVNEAKLREAVQNDPQAVLNLFTTTSTTYENQGLGYRVYEQVNNKIDRLKSEAGYPNTSSIYDNSFISKSIRSIDTRVTEMEARLEMLEARYWRQFTAMEQAIAQFNAQSAWLSRQQGGY